MGRCFGKKAPTVDKISSSCHVHMVVGQSQVIFYGSREAIDKGKKMLQQVLDEVFERLELSKEQCGALQLYAKELANDFKGQLRIEVNLNKVQASVRADNAKILSKGLESIRASIAGE